MVNDFQCDQFVVSGIHTCHKVQACIPGRHHRRGRVVVAFHCTFRSFTHLLYTNFCSPHSRKLLMRGGRFNTRVDTSRMMVSFCFVSTVSYHLVKRTLPWRLTRKRKWIWERAPCVDAQATKNHIASCLTIFPRADAAYKTHCLLEATPNHAISHALAKELDRSHLWVTLELLRDIRHPRVWIGVWK